MSSQYFRVAMNSTRVKYKTASNDVLFVMASDDIDWCRTMFSNETDVVFASSAAEKYNVTQPTFDMAVLSMCHHSIMRWFAKLSFTKSMTTEGELVMDIP